MAAVLLGIAFRRPASIGPSDEFTARGASIETRPALLVYAMRTAERFPAVEAKIRAGDDLAFAYTNASGYKHLFVFGVDEHRHVYWYYPAWTSADDDPHGVDVAAGPEVRELPEAIRHELDGRELTIHAVFLDDDTSVKRIEAMLAARARAPGDALPFARAYEQRITIEVAP
jgi:hypothetical protein